MFSKRWITEELLHKFDRYEEPYFYHTLRFEMGKVLPLVKVHLYSFETEKAEYFYAIRESQLVKNNILVIGKGQFNESDYLLGFNKFVQATGIFSTLKAVNAVGRDVFIQPIVQFMRDSACPYKVIINPCFEFIVPKEKEEILMKKEEEVELPEGYSIGPSDPKDAAFITSKWKFASEGEIDNTIQKITSLPSTSIRNEKKELVAFEMADVCGGLSHLYVLEENRRRGLGKAVEEDLARKMIRAGITAFKYVEQDNFIVAESSMRSPYWTVRRKEDQSYNFMTWMQLIPIS